MKKYPLIVGQKFNRLTVLSEHKVKRKPRKFLCKCDCGNLKFVRPSHLHKGLRINTGGVRSCGCLLKERYKRPFKGKDHPCWKGGTTTRPGGYLAIHMPDHHRANHQGYVLEHILVMEKKIGRRLLKGENVHHINGQKKDNRPENLELWSSSQPSGQRVEDKIKWAKEILKTYNAFHP